ncbi:SRPBCC family protein [Planosporangium sp. 12N6]|uniref:SRPBCC family protein n=1 Tax=Planosporangium spinosum TaxID=3402278 RepID=UPI003CE87595
MTSSGTATVTLPTDTRIMITREFDAPARLVWKAYTTPDLIRRWWGGERGTVTVADVDLRVGGRWRYALVANGGFEVAFHGEYREIVPAERLVNTEVYEGIPDAEEQAALVTATLTEKDGRTLLEVLVEHRDKAGRDAHIDSGMEGGMQEAIDALEHVAVDLAAVERAG